MYDEPNCENAGVLEVVKNMFWTISKEEKMVWSTRRLWLDHNTPWLDDVNGLDHQSINKEDVSNFKVQ